MTQQHSLIDAADDPINAMSADDLRAHLRYDMIPNGPPVTWAEYALAQSISNLDNKIAALADTVRGLHRGASRITPQPPVIFINGSYRSYIYDPATGFHYTLEHSRGGSKSKLDYCPIRLRATSAAHSTEDATCNVYHDQGEAIDFWGQLIGHFYAAGKLTKAQYDLGHQIILIATERLSEWENS